tara:strand:- start:391 stop:750 length:360 start_codon:yes stop_codon:yes gene_type:complete
MPFRGPGIHESPYGNPGAPNVTPAINPRMQEDLDIEYDQKLRDNAERFDKMQESWSPIRVNERMEKLKERRAKRKAPKPGIDNLVPKGMDPFVPMGPQGPVPMGPPPVPPGQNPFGPKQ